MSEERERRRRGWLTNEWANADGRLDRPALSPKAFVASNLAGLCSDGRTDGRTDDKDGREPTKRRAGKTKTTIPKQTCFSAFSKLQEIKPETQIPRRRSFGWTNERTDDQDGRELTQRRAGTTETTTPETNLFLCLSVRMDERTIRWER